MVYADRRVDRMRHRSRGSIYFQQSLQITLIAGAIGAFFGGVTAFALYRVGLFVLCAGLTFFGFYFFFPTDSRQALLFYLIAGRHRWNFIQPI